jgi:WD40 repeat protein
VAFSPDGQFVMGGALRTLSLWDVETGEVVRSFAGHRSTINSVAFLPDGQYAISASSDQTLILWDIATGDEVFRFEGHRQSVTDLDINTDGTRFISGSSDQTLIVWRVDSLSSLIDWTCDNRVIGRLDADDLAAFRIDEPRFSCEVGG